MSDAGSRNKGRIALLGSVALNIFLVAFVLGHFGAFGMMLPPPPFMMGGHPMMPPPMMEGMLPPPPFFGPSDLFSREEMKENFAHMQDNFKKIQDLRHAFAEQLKKGSVTKEDVLKNFAQIDQLMIDVKKQAQEKAAEKISSMSLDQRKRFADRLSGNE